MASQTQTHYETLGLHPQSTPEQIKTQYRRLALQHHPDKGGDEDLFKRIQSAAECLLDDKARHRYDDLLREARNERFFSEAREEVRTERKEEQSKNRRGWWYDAAWEDLGNMFESFNINETKEGPRPFTKPFSTPKDEWNSGGSKSRFRRPSRERMWVEY